MLRPFWAMPFRLWTRVGPIRHVLHGVPYLLTRSHPSADHASDTPWAMDTSYLCAPGHNTLHTAAQGDAAFCEHYWGNLLKLLTYCYQQWAKYLNDDKRLMETVWFCSSATKWQWNVTRSPAVAEGPREHALSWIWYNTAQMFDGLHLKRPATSECPTRSFKDTDTGAIP